uniref:Protein kinase domain-containing protein n=1 Tax=Macrostomum lignano TaxID=282301 RepID=A0A1I8FK39_9PLAT
IPRLSPRPRRRNAASAVSEGRGAAAPALALAYGAGRRRPPPRPLAASTPIPEAVATATRRPAVPAAIQQQRNFKAIMPQRRRAPGGGFPRSVLISSRTDTPASFHRLRIKQPSEKNYSPGSNWQSSTGHWVHSARLPFLRHGSRGHRLLRPAEAQPGASCTLTGPAGPNGEADPEEAMKAGQGPISGRATSTCSCTPTRLMRLNGRNGVRLRAFPTASLRPTLSNLTSQRAGQDLPAGRRQAEAFFDSAEDQPAGRSLSVAKKIVDYGQPPPPHRSHMSSHARRGTGEFLGPIQRSSCLSASRSGSQHWRGAAAAPLPLTASTRAAAVGSRGGIGGGFEAAARSQQRPALGNLAARRALWRKLIAASGCRTRAPVRSGEGVEWPSWCLARLSPLLLPEPGRPGALNRICRRLTLLRQRPLLRYAKCERLLEHLVGRFAIKFSRSLPPPFPTIPITCAAGAGPRRPGAVPPVLQEANPPALLVRGSARPGRPGRQPGATLSETAQGLGVYVSVEQFTRAMFQIRNLQSADVVTAANAVPNQTLAGRAADWTSRRQKQLRQLLRHVPARHAIKPLASLFSTASAGFNLQTRVLKRRRQELSAAPACEKRAPIHPASSQQQQQQQHTEALFIMAEPNLPGDWAVAAAAASVSASTRELSEGFSQRCATFDSQPLLPGAECRFARCAGCGAAGL